MKRLIFITLMAVSATACDVSRPEWKNGPDAGSSAPVAPELWLEDSCGQQACTLDVVQRDTRIDIAVDLCGSAALQLDWQQDSQSWSALRNQEPCTTLTDEGGVFGAWTCGACDIYLHPVVEPEQLDLQSLSLRDAPNYVPLGQSSQPLEGYDPLTGLLADMVVLGDGRIVVAQHADDGDGLMFCDDPGPSTLSWVDPETLQVTHTATAPPCLIRIAADDNDGLYGAYGGEAPKLARFDAQGTLVEQLPLQLPTTPVPVFVTSLVVTPSRVHLVLTSQLPPRTTVVGTLDRATGANLGWISIPTVIFRDALVDRGGLLSADRNEAFLYRLQPEQQIAEPFTTLFDVLRRSDDGGALMLTAAGRLIVSTTGHYGAIHVLVGESDGYRLGPVTPFFEVPGVPWATSEWSQAPNHVMVGITEVGPNPRAFLARYDPVRGRFSPGATPLGLGIVAKLLPGRGDTLWALLSWQGQLVRIR